MTDTNEPSTRELEHQIHEQESNSSEKEIYFIVLTEKDKNGETRLAFFFQTIIENNRTRTLIIKKTREGRANLVFFFMLWQIQQLFYSFFEYSTNSKSNNIHSWNSD